MSDDDENGSNDNDGYGGGEPIDKGGDPDNDS